MTEGSIAIDPVTESDLPEMNRLVNDPIVSRYLDLVPPISLARTFDFFRYVREEGGACWTIRVDGTLAGTVGLIPADLSTRLGHTASVFVYLDTAWWGRGLAAQGIRVCVDEARRRRLVRLEALVVDENERSRRLLLRSGFVIEGVRRCGFRGDDRYHDLLALALVLDTSFTSPRAPGGACRPGSVSSPFSPAPSTASPMDEIEIVDLPAQAVLGIRQRGPYSRIPELLMQVFGVIMEKGAIPAGAPVYLSHETTREAALDCMKRGEADLEVAFPIANRVKDEGEVRYYELAGGRFARLVHRGPYNQCDATYDRLFAWLADHGLPLTGPIREYYLNDPSEVAPEEILTEIYAPVG